MAKSSQTYQSIEKLLQFQNSFLNSVHSQVLTHQQLEKRKQALLKFQVLEISDKNEIFNQVITTLKKQLIEQKVECDSYLKGYFIKLLELDYLPLLHVNRYELTKLSIFGFDIYIDPLQAILQILNRLQRILYILQDSLKDQQLSDKVAGLGKQRKNISDILLCGWKEYYCFLHFHKLSLNIYMLKQYINIAITSLPRKDKEIIFTGVYNLYKRLIPILSQHHLIAILEELSDLNNMMYNFHPSFDYFLFYTYLEPSEQQREIFSRINELQRKCSHTNILTPLLVGIMNNYKSFVKFISKVQSPQYVHLLRVLLSGLIINFKVRILEYNQVLELIGLTINKLCLLNKMKLSIITSQLSQQWQQAKDFFISAFKSGYNPGQIQTWTLSDLNLIQPTIINFLIKGLLLTPNCRNDEFLKKLQKSQLQEVLQSQIKQLTDQTQTLKGLMNNWKLLSINYSKKQKITQIKSQQQQEDYEKLQNIKNQEKNQTKTSKIKEMIWQKRESKCLNLIRIINLISFLDIKSQRLVYSIVSVLNNFGVISSELHREKLQQSIETLNEVISEINRQQSISNLKEILPQFHFSYPPKRTFQDIVPVYLHSFLTRQAISNLIQIIISNQQHQKTLKQIKVLQVRQSKVRVLYIKQILTALVHKYFVKSAQQKTVSYEIYKSFDKQYKIPSIIFNIDSQTNSIFFNLVKILTSSQTQRIKSEISSQILINLLKHSPYHIIGVFNLPVTQNLKITSFLTWLVNSQYQSSRYFLISALNLLNQFADKNKYILDFKLYLYECYYLSVLDIILSSLAETIESQKWHQVTNNVHKILSLINLFIQIYSKFLSNPIQSTQQHISNILQTVWINILEILTSLLKNSPYHTQTLNKSCQLFWKIIQIIQGDHLHSWYYQLATKRIFSTLITQNLLYNQTFKSIILINTIKNYLISKENNEQNLSNFNEKPQHYVFADIKAFFENNYLETNHLQEACKQDLSQNKNLLQKSDEEIRDFLSQIYKFRNLLREVKTQIIPRNQKQMPPCLLQQTMEKIYGQYCRKKCQKDEQSDIRGLQFSLMLLVLNPVNHRNLWKIIMKSQKKTFLQNMSFTRQTINEVLQVLKHLENKANEQTNLLDTKKSQLQIQYQINCMLGLDLLQNRVNELQLLASAYYLDNSNLQIFLKHKEVLWFLIVYNNSNWRQFNEIFSTHVKNQCFLQNLLQYKEYLSITLQTNNDYQKKVQEFSLLIDQYLFYAEKKLYSIDLLKTNDSQKENSIRKSTLLINIKVLLLKCQMQKILQKIQFIVKLLHQNSLSDKKIRLLISILHKLNKLCNKFIGGSIKLPDFVHNNWFTTYQSLQKQFLLGSWIEECEKVIENQESVQEQLKYFPQKNHFFIKINMQDFKSDEKNEDIVFRRILDVEIDREECHREYQKLHQNLKNYLQTQNKKIQLRHINCAQTQVNSMNDFYRFGYLYFIQKNIIEKTELNLSPLLKSLIKRQKIPLELIKQIDAQGFHHLKLLTMNDKVPLNQTTNQQHQIEENNSNTQNEYKTKQKLNFVWNDKQLIAKGKQVTVNLENKNFYIQLVGEQILGKCYLQLNNSFALGYINASIVHCSQRKGFEEYKNDILSKRVR